MPENLVLTEKKQQVRKDLHRYRSLPEYILDGVGVMVDRISNPKGRKMRTALLPPDPFYQEEENFPSYWWNGFVIALVTLSIGYLITLLQNHTFSVDERYLIFWSAGNGALALIANKVNIRAFLKTFDDSLLDKMLSETDLAHLKNWMDVNFSVWKPLISGLVVGPGLAWLLYSSWLFNHKPLGFQPGVFAVILLSSIQSVWVGYYLFPFYVAFPLRMTHYQFDLYAADPSSSEVVGRLSRLLTFILYVTLGFIVQLTVGLTMLNVLTSRTPLAGFVFSFFVWAPTVILYGAGQYHLSDLISRAKWKMLNEVQTKIEELYGAEEIPDKDNLEKLSKLMDYHDRIKSTADSALNFRSSLNVLNSLLLPILAFVFTNLDKVTTLVAKLMGGNKGSYP